MTKLIELFQREPTNTKFSLAPAPSQVVEPSVEINKPKTVINSQNSNELNVIGEEEDEGPLIVN